MSKEKKYLILLVLLLYVPAQAFCLLPGRWTIKTAYSKSYLWEHEIRVYFANQPENTPSNGEYKIYKTYNPMLTFELNRALTRFLEIGAYLGYSPIEIKLLPEPRHSSKDDLLSFGLNANYQILPHYIQADDFRIDCYLSGKLGSTNQKGNPLKWYSYLDYGLYAGAAFYLGRHWGIHAEYGFSNHTTFRYGLCWKF